MSIIIGIIGALATVTAAGISAHYGAQKGLQRHKRERAFDARLGWYVEIAGVLTRASIRLQRAALVLRTLQPPPGRTVTEVATEGVEAYWEAVEAIQQTRIFATEDVASSLTEALLRADEEISGIEDPNLSRFAEHLDLLGEVLLEASEELEEAAREHLGYEQPR